MPQGVEVQVLSPAPTYIMEYLTTAYDYLASVYDLKGLIVLSIASLAFALSHSFLKKYHRNLNFNSKLIGFAAFVSIFFISGIKAGLIAAPIIFIVAFLGAVITGETRK